MVDVSKCEGEEEHDSGEEDIIGSHEKSSIQMVHLKMDLHFVFNLKIIST